MGWYDLTLSRRDHNHMTGFVIQMKFTGSSSYMSSALLF